VESSAGCDCTFVLLQTDLRATGTYTTSGTSLTGAPTGGNEALGGGGTGPRGAYCVDGDRLHVLMQDATMSIVSDVVGRKRL
jgi:hypothetical protein